jgi:hypothetical protein
LPFALGFSRGKVSCPKLSYRNASTPPSGYFSPWWTPHDASREIGADLTTALLPGSSFIKRPESLSAQYQEYLLKRLVAELEDASDIPAIDLATRIQAATKDNKKTMVFPE